VTTAIAQFMRELEHVWDEHTDALLVRRDVTASLTTVGPVPSVLHIPAMTGAVGSVFTPRISFPTCPVTCSWPGSPAPWTGSAWSMR
jgi:hypothetical protein